MRLGDHPELLAAVVEALGGCGWAFGVSVYASESPPGYRVTVTAGGRFLTHSRTVVLPVAMKAERHVAHAVAAAVEEMRLELEGFL